MDSDQNNSHHFWNQQQLLTVFAEHSKFRTDGPDLDDKNDPGERTRYSPYGIGPIWLACSKDVSLEILPMKNFDNFAGFL